MNTKKLIFIGALLGAFLLPAHAQQPGLINSGTVLGNSTAAARTPTQTQVPALFDRAFCTTVGSLIIRATGGWACGTVLGVPGSVLGTLGFAGNTSGVVTVQPQAVAGTYNFNLPTSAGSAGAPLLSGGGGASPQTYGIVGGAFGGTGVNNGASTITVGGNFATSGAFATTLIATATTNATLPAGTQTLAALTLPGQNVTGGTTVTALSQATGNLTVDCGARPLQFITNGGAFTLTAPANDGTCILMITNNASAGAVTFSGFSVGANVGDPLTTTNTSKFMVWIARINGISTYRIAATQ